MILQIELPYRDRDVEKYILAVAEGVIALRRRGFARRGLKPQNVMRRKNGDPVIIDFGLVKEYRKPAAANALCETVSVIDGRAVGVGTPRYSAPEQFSGGEATPSSDVHALGALVNECFGGFPPRCWAKIVRRATSSILEQRYISVSEFVRAVKARHRARRFAFAAFAVAIVALAVVAIWQWCE